jgi:DNA (cytosine-5)-methyltransferase 1
MRYLSVCSGIEAASVAWEPLGWAPVAFSEIEAFPSAVLAHHYPAVPNWGDMTKFRDWPDATVDVLVGGTPCQSFSVAGLRRGLDDDRGNLMLVYAEIARRYRPQVCVWENVPGVLSSDGGRDFASLLGLLSGRRVEVPADGWRNAGIVEGYEGAYGLAWRVLDAQFTRTCSHPRAVPQRRRRVFVVGHSGDWRRAAAVLFERESLSWHSAPRRQAGQGTAVATDGGVAGCLAANMGQGNQFAQSGQFVGICTDVVSSLTASGRGVERPSETRGQDPVVAVPSTGEVSHCLNAGGMGRIDYETETMIACPVADTLSVGANQTTGFPSGAVVAHSLRADGFDASEDGTGRGTPLVSIAPTLSSSGAGTARTGNARTEAEMLVTQGWAVRRLTPTECERLQGFPDSYTAIPYRNKPAADGPRYKALGNSMAVNCMRWIGRRIEAVALLDARRNAA